MAFLVVPYHDSLLQRVAHCFGELNGFVGDAGPAGPLRGRKHGPRTLTVDYGAVVLHLRPRLHLSRPEHGG